VDTDFQQNAAFHDELAPRYDAHVTNNACNILARQAFIDLTTQYVSPGSTPLDFGCGTGIDALQYVQKGYRVLAYDNSPGMIGQLEQRCMAEIALGKITAWSEPYPSFLASFPLTPTPSAVAADFAVLNSIQDLEQLFKTLAQYLAPPGLVICSLLNPLHWLKLKTPGWWIKALRERNGSPVYAADPLQDVYALRAGIAPVGPAVPFSGSRQFGHVRPLRCGATRARPLLVGSGRLES
jgi:SAM-dependent methyltransferase